MAASIKDIVNSCLALANNNNGLFKSEKQAKFLTDFFIDGSLTASVAYSFGEFNGCTRRVDYVIAINSTGIQKIIKNSVELMDFVKTMVIEKLTKEIEELQSLLQ